MRVLFIVSLVVVGVLLGLRVSQVAEDTQSGPWETLPPPPTRITELIPAVAPPLFVKTSDGTTYRYEEWQGGGWIPDEPPATPSIRPIEIRRPCDLSAPEFFRFSIPAAHMTDCLQAIVMDADGFVYYAFVLDNAGNLWQSSFTRTAYETISTTLSFAVLGGLLGLCGSLLVIALINRRRTSLPHSHPPFGAA